MAASQTPRSQSVPPSVPEVKLENKVDLEVIFYQEGDPVPERILAPSEYPPASGWQAPTKRYVDKRAVTELVDGLDRFLSDGVKWDLGAHRVLREGVPYLEVLANVDDNQMANNLFNIEEESFYVEFRLNGYIHRFEGYRFAVLFKRVYPSMFLMVPGVPRLFARPINPPLLTSPHTP